MAEGLLRGTDVAAGVVVEIVGLPFALSAADERRGEALAAFLRHAPPVAAEPRVRMAFTAEPVDPPDRAPDRVLDDVGLWRDRGSLVVGLGERLMAEATDRHVTVRGDDPMLSRAFRRVALHALGHVLAAHDRYLVHAAALADGNAAVLVLGQTGSGKSTLAFAALRHGWDVLADDLVAVRRHPSGPVRVTGVPRPICVPHDLDGVDGFGAQPIGDDVRDRLELGRGTVQLDEIVLAGVVVVTHGAEPGGSLAPIGGQAALRHVLTSTVSLEDPTHRGDVLTLAAAMSRLPAWVLHHGAEPISRVEVAGRHLDEIADALAGTRTQR